ncbi:hypothetical protein [Lutibacter sp.]|uniref:hypothetical protein n=1 Tax=Lutibacter sp. TaxID=1925666 RepID=UPI00349FED3E
MEEESIEQLLRANRIANINLKRIRFLMNSSNNMNLLTHIIDCKSSIEFSELMMLKIVPDDFLINNGLNYDKKLKSYYL